MAAVIAAQPMQTESTYDLKSTPKSAFWTMKSGVQIEIRPIQTEDEQRMIKFHKGLSERTVYMRYFESLSLDVRTAHPRLARICFADPQRETVLVALCGESQSDDKKIAAVGRLTKLPDSSDAEVALLVLDEFQSGGLGTELLRQLIQAARDQQISRIEAEMLRDNLAIQRVLKKFGFRLRLTDPRSLRAVLSL